MSASSSNSESYFRRNLPVIIAGGAALLAVIAIIVVLVDRAGGDDEPTLAVQAVDGRADDGGSSAFGFVGGVLLGVAVDEQDGALLVRAVSADSPADEAGIEVGDEIREVDGERIRSFEELRSALEAIEPDTEYEIAIVRDGDDRTLTARRGEALGGDLAALLDQLDRGGLDLEDFDLEGFDLEGLDLGDLEGLDLERFLDGFDLDQLLEEFGQDDFDLHQFLDELDQGRFDLERFLEDFRFEPRTDRFGPNFGGAPFFLPGGEGPLGVTVEAADDGVAVTTVVSRSPADLGGVRAGDLIVGLNGERIRTVDDLREAWASALQTRGGAPVLLEVERNGRSQTLILSSFVPQGPELGLATPTPDLRAQEFQEQLQELREFLESDRFLDQLGERLRGDLVRYIDEVLATATADPASAPSDADAAPSPTLAGLDVFRGSVEALSDTSITLGGSRGLISFDLTEETEMVGSEPRLGGITTVASNADLEAMLVLTAS